MEKNLEYKQKYLKYKSKYLELQKKLKIMSGGRIIPEEILKTFTKDDIIDFIKGNLLVENFRKDNNSIIEFLRNIMENDDDYAATKKTDVYNIIENLKNDINFNLGDFNKENENFIIDNNENLQVTFISKINSDKTNYKIPKIYKNSILKSILTYLNNNIDNPPDFISRYDNFNFYSHKKNKNEFDILSKEESINDLIYESDIIIHYEPKNENKINENKINENKINENIIDENKKNKILKFRFISKNDNSQKDEYNISSDNKNLTLKKLLQLIRIPKNIEENLPNFITYPYNFNYFKSEVDILNLDDTVDNLAGDDYKLIYYDPII